MEDIVLISKSVVAEVDEEGTDVAREMEVIVGMVTEFSALLISVTEWLATQNNTRKDNPGQ